MIEPIVLSDSNAEEARATFQSCLDDIYTLLVIPGTHVEALKALDVANDFINTKTYNVASIRAVHAPVPEFIVPVMSQLHISAVQKKIDWDNIRHYAVFSISNKYNNIGGAFAK